MHTTFENADQQHKRRQTRERHLRMIDNISRNSVFLSLEEANFAPIEEAEALSAQVDALSGQPLEKQTLPSDANLTGRRTNLRGRVVIFVLFIVFLSITLFVSILSISSKKSHPQASAVISQSDAKLARYKRLFSMVLDWQVTTRDRLENGNDACAKALYWLAFEDPDYENSETLRTRYALAVVYFSTHGRESTASWIHETHWLSSYPVCLWYGVDCLDVNAEYGLVRALNLSANSLDGTIPPEIALLQLDVRFIDFSGNLLGGSIPDLSNLKNLQKLYLGSNDFTGTIPESIFQLSHLTHLFINDCLLTGTISSKLSLLSKLHALGLQENSLSGSIPSVIGNLDLVRVLYLDANLLTGTIPRSIPSSLIDLRLSRNKLIGPIPPELSNSRFLEVLYLDENQLEGTIPSTVVGSLPLLVEMQLHNNLLTGKLPNELANLVMLAMLFLNGNLFSGPIPDLGSIKYLKSIYLYDNLLTGPIPRSFGSMQYLVNLEIFNNDLTGTIPTELGLMSSLETLYLNNNTWLHGPIPSELLNLSNLESAHFHGNHFTGWMPFCPNRNNGLVSLTSDCNSAMFCSCCTNCYT